MKPSQKDIVDAVARMTALAMFPNNPAAHKEIMRLLDRMVSTRAQLDWLVQTMIDRVGTWPGTSELRGIFCTRFKPKDGIEVWSSVGGFTAADSEDAYLAAFSAERSRELSTPRKSKMLPAAKVDPETLQ